MGSFVDSNSCGIIFSLSCPEGPWVVHYSLVPRGTVGTFLDGTPRDWGCLLALLGVPRD